MTSINFPRMFTHNRTLLNTDQEAVKSNLYLILKSDKNSLLGDPYFGNLLKQMIYSPNNRVLRGLVIDEIYTCILIFEPKIYLTRKDIDVVSQKDSLYATIKYSYKIDGQSDMYVINLTENQADSYTL